jgi:hypothetical protein
MRLASRCRGYWAIEQRACPTPIEPQSPVERTKAEMEQARTRYALAPKDMDRMKASDPSTAQATGAEPPRIKRFVIAHASKA